MKISTGILLIAAASASLGMLTGTASPFHLLNRGDWNAFNDAQRMAAFSPTWITEQASVETWMHDMSNWAGAPQSMNSPVELVAEPEAGIESWMTAPFESGLAEESLIVEDWMTAPFEAGIALDKHTPHDFGGQDLCTNPDTDVSFPFTKIHF